MFYCTTFSSNTVSWIYVKLAEISYEHHIVQVGAELHRDFKARLVLRDQYSRVIKYRFQKRSPSCYWNSITFLFTLCRFVNTVHKNVKVYLLV